MSRISLARTVTLLGYFGLLGLVLAWNIWLAPPPKELISLTLLLLAVPLLFPLRGLLHGRAYTHAWAGFIALIYLLHAMVVIYSNPAERYLALMEFVLGMMMFVGAMVYARLKGKTEQQSIKQD